MAGFTERRERLLCAMLGIRAGVKRAHWGYRNFYCANILSNQHDELCEMAAIGLVVPGAFISGGAYQYFHATRAGCEAVGLNESATRKALHDLTANMLVGGSCQYCGGRNLDHERFIGKVFCNECEKLSN